MRGSSTTVGIVALVAGLWFGASFWGALDTAFCRIYALPCRSWVRQKLFGLAMLGLVLVFFAATVAVPAVQSLLLANAADLPFGLGDRHALFAITLGAGLVITFGALATIYRTVPNTPVGWHGVWPGALGATVAIGVVDYAFPFYLNNVSSLAGVRTTVVFILILLVWFYMLAIIILGGAVVNELRLEHRRTDTLADMPDPTTEGMRLEQIEREREEHARAEAAEDPETEQHDRRAERAGYLQEKLGERGAEAEDAAGEGGVDGRARGARGRLEDEVADMENQSGRSTGDIDEAKADWERKKQRRVGPRRRHPRRPARIPATRVGGARATPEVEDENA